MIWLYILTGLMFAALFMLRRNFSKIRGWNGECIMANRLRKGLPSSDYFVFNNVYLPLADGTTTQIDHIVVSVFGVFVIETKNYSGWIFASAESKVWTETFRTSKHAFQNPLRQNYRHMCAIAENLGLPKDYMRNVIAFTDGEFKTEMPEGVVYSSGVVRYIKSFETRMLKHKEVEQIVAAITEWDATVSDSQRTRHVENLKSRHAEVSDGTAIPTCPYCGGEMRLRHRNADDKPFYGCKSYPRCKGIVNVQED